MTTPAYMNTRTYPRLVRAKLRLGLRSAIKQIRAGEHEGALMNLGYAFATAGLLFDLGEEQAAFACATNRTLRILRALQCRMGKVVT